MSHPIHHKDPDVGCRWLCLTAGQRTRQDQEELTKALLALPFQGQSQTAASMPIDPGRIWERVR